MPWVCKNKNREQENQLKEIYITKMITNRNKKEVKECNLYNFIFLKFKVNFKEFS